MEQKKIKIKGNTGTIKYIYRCDEECGGLTDATIKTIKLFYKDEKSDYGDFDVFMKQVLRHELVHAFLHECGLGDQLQNTERGHDEQMVDGFASQYHEYKKVCEELGV